MVHKFTCHISNVVWKINNVKNPLQKASIHLKIHSALFSLKKIAID